jgi:signal transduction histidine kinase
VLVSRPVTLVLGAFTMLATAAVAVFHRREKRRLAELSAARKIIDEITHEQWLVLSEASKALPASLDYREVMRRMATIAVPSLACCCTIDFVEEERTWLRVRSQRHRISGLLTEEVVTAPDDPSHCLNRALRGEAQVYSSEDLPSTLRQILFGDAVATSAALTAAIVVPMNSSHGPLGVLTFGLTTPGRRYAGFDLDLARQLAARAALALDNARLYRQTQSAVQARDRLLAIVSHELKNPLTAIGLQAQYLLRYEKDPKQAAQIEAIQSFAQRMQGIINDLLDLDQIEGGRLAIKLALEDASQLVRDPIEMMQPMARNKGITLSADVPENRAARIRADRHRISQVISNLVGNAIKFTPSGGTVSVLVRYENNLAEICVSDTGPGMSPESLARAFDRYWQDGKTAHLGSGLGLTIAKGIVELHGGTIGIESVAGQGTTVRFTLPLQPQLSPSPGSAAQASLPVRRVTETPSSAS